MNQMLCSSVLAALEEPQTLVQGMPGLLRVVAQESDSLNADPRWQKRLSELSRGGDGECDPRVRWAACVLLAASAQRASHDAVAQNVGRWAEDAAAALRCDCAFSAAVRGAAAIAAAAALTRAASAAPDTRRTAAHVAQRLVPPVAALLATHGVRRPALSALAAVAAADIAKPHAQRIADALLPLFDDAAAAAGAGRCAARVAMAAAPVPAAAAAQFAAAAVGSLHAVVSEAFRGREPADRPAWRALAEAQHIAGVADCAGARAETLLARATALSAAIAATLCPPQDSSSSPTVLVQFPADQLLDLIARMLSVTAETAFATAGGLPLHAILALLPPLHTLALKLLSSITIALGRLCLSRVGVISDLLCSELWACLRAPHPTVSDELLAALFRAVAIFARISSSGAFAGKALPYVVCELRKPFDGPAACEKSLQMRPSKKRKQGAATEALGAAAGQFQSAAAAAGQTASPVFVAALEALESILSSSLLQLDPESHRNVARLLVQLTNGGGFTTGRAQGLVCRCVTLCATSAVHECASLLPLALAAVGAVPACDGKAVAEARIASVACEAFVHPRMPPLTVCPPVEIAADHQQQQLLPLQHPEEGQLAIPVMPAVAPPQPIAATTAATTTRAVASKAPSALLAPPTAVVMPPAPVEPLLHKATFAVPQAAPAPAAAPPKEAIEEADIPDIVDEGPDADEDMQ